MRTQLWFLAWNVFGLLVYALYSRRNAVLGRSK
jgi:APA family basic amino acid/polyamine antiporter